MGHSLISGYFSGPNSMINMLKFFLLLSVFVAGTYAASVRIVNGTDAEEGEFPFAVSLRRDNRLTCGSTILNENFILTAAHCVCDDSSPLDATMFSIQYGLTTRTDDMVNIIPVEKIYCNNFSMDELIFDSAVLQLKAPIPQDGSWAPVKIAREFDTSVEQKGVIIGWGRLLQDGPLPMTLQKLNVDIYDDALCGRDYNNEHHICFGADNAGACNGDSGTALLVNQVQVGIASFITEECGIANKTYPNVYSRVSTYYDWINSIAGPLN